ncbi:PqiC family protein [Sedimentitalea arenosa]|jgi:uncharacterized lipoprotein YmbA|uniref:Membrane integrity-associated transporter subunit PqiC n=1 Tax=Sedimentitalea arenosa TaxID=2798803 RepID=A0A8J7J197_9RHOB|nr:PqiC family protein [Arenibacterium arenosum]MBJ6371410.1 membrane integrity-associated transporter subunit PqiC [Arenibacterium arenosum]
MTASFRLTLGLLSALALTACGDPAARYLLEPPTAQERMRLPVSTIELREVTLPVYASGSEIMLQGEDGALRPSDNAVWADDQVRAVTLSLARDIEAVSTATAAAEPWPLIDSPQVRVEVRIDRMVAQTDGVFRMSGQFAIASPGGAVRETLNRFDIAQPMAAGTPTAIADATSAAITTLARQIANRLSR